MIQSIQLKGGTAMAMSEANPLLARREIAVEFDTGKIKVGNGSDYWNDLPYSGANASDSVSQNQVYMLVNTPAEWSPEIDPVDTISLYAGQPMTPIQFTGLNSEVNL